MQFKDPLNDMSKSEEEIPKNIRKIRLELGLTQEQFAVKLGVSFPTVNRWENQISKPSPLALQKLEKLFLVLKKKTLLNQNQKTDAQESKNILQDVAR
jgi:putative transcriptional regulator